MAANKDALLVKEARKKLERNPALTSDVNANRIFKEYQDLKLIPKKYKVKEHFLNAVSKVAKEKNLTAKKAADYLVKINKLENRSRFNPEAADWIINKVKYEGIPLELDSKGKARFATRRFHEKPPKQLQDFVKKLEKNKNLPHGTWEKFTRYAKESWEEAGEKNRKLFEKTGILFDRGHLNESKSGGPNVGMNQRSERALGPGGNRSKGATPNFKTPDIPKYIGVPKMWTDAFTEYLLKKEGLSATGLRIGEELTSGDFALIEQGAHPDVVVARRKAQYDAERPTIKQPLPESHSKIVEQQKGARSRVQVDKNIPKQNQTILGIVKQNGDNGTTGTKKNPLKINGKKLGLGAAALTMGSNFIPSKSAAKEIRDEVSQGEIGDATKTYAKDLLIGHTASRSLGSLLKIAKSKLSGNIAKKVIGRQLLKKGAALATGPAAPIVMGGLLIKDAYDVANVISGDKLKIRENKDMSTDERKKAVERLKFIK